MGRQPCCDKVGLKKGPWTAEEDKKLIHFIFTNGQCCWRALPKLAGLLRCGKSCRLRWTNYLRPDLKRGLLSESEERIVIDLHAQLGNRWSKIASHLPGRTDNEIKNHWNTHIKKKLRKMGIDPLTHKPLPISTTEQEPVSEFDQNVPETATLLSPITTTTEDSNGFCTDDVPLVEILVPSTSSSCSSSSDNCLLEELMQFPEFEWPNYISNSNNNMSLWCDDWDSLLNDDDPPTPNQCSRMVFDHDQDSSWTYGLI